MIPGLSPRDARRLLAFKARLAASLPAVRSAPARARQRAYVTQQITRELAAMGLTGGAS